jgi:hypothetical protein
MLYTLENFYMYSETKHGNQINEELTGQPNLIYEALFQHPPHIELDPPQP